MIAWVAQSALATSVLIVAVLLLRRPVAKAFGARAAYALWLAPALRAILPPINMPSLIPAAAMPEAGADNFTLVSEPAAASSMPLVEIAIAVWLTGGLIYLVLCWWRHQRFLTDALAHGRPLNRSDIPYDVVATTSVDGPLATGLIHPLILVPDDFLQRFSVDQQRLALRHEQAHHRRGDIWASLAAMLITAFLWFNPFAHMALRAFRRDMEAACDARVLEESGRDATTPYAETILRCVGRQAPRSLCALTSVDELKGRLMMLNISHGATRKLIGLALAAGLTAGGLLFAAPAVAVDQKADDREVIKQIEIRKTKDGDSIHIKSGEGGPSKGLPLTCPGKIEVVSEGTGQTKESVKYMLCSKEGESMVTALEKAAADIEKRDEISAARKADILNKLRSRIAELRAKG